MSGLSLSINNPFLVHKGRQESSCQEIESSVEQKNISDNLSSDYVWEGLALLILNHLKIYFEAHGEILPAEGLYNRILKEVEKPLITQTLEVVKGNQGKAAKILGIHRNTLRKKIQELNLSFIAFQ